MLSSINAFEKFLSDGAVYSPDVYFCTECEDFSPNAVIDEEYFNNYKPKAKPAFKYALIA